jgi:DNA-binding NarL/FixJ family response regulator
MKSEGVQNSGPDGLPMRLGQVAGLISRGYSDKQIAQELGLSPHTIHRHVARLLKHLGAENRAVVAAIWARRTMDVERNDWANGSAPADRPKRPPGG